MVKKKVDRLAVVRALMSNISVIIISVVFRFVAGDTVCLPIKDTRRNVASGAQLPKVTLLQASCMIEVAFTV